MHQFEITRCDNGSKFQDDSTARDNITIKVIYDVRLIGINHTSGWPIVIWKPVAIIRYKI